jgi:hypothetical protein
MRPAPMAPGGFTVSTLARHGANLRSLTGPLYCFGTIIAVLVPRNVAAQKLAKVPEDERQQKPMFHLNRSDLFLVR